MEILKLNRMNDALFKNIFALNSDITLSLINSVFEFQGTELITDIEFIDRNLDAQEDDGKESRLDLLGKASDGTIINLEIQVAKQEYMGRRSLYYWSRLYNELKSGEEYTELKRTVTINMKKKKTGVELLCSARLQSMSFQNGVSLGSIGSPRKSSG